LRRIVLVRDGNFLPWIEAEFGMHENTARNFMRVAEMFGKSTTVVDLPPTVLYALAAPSTPEDAPGRTAAFRNCREAQRSTKSTSRPFRRDGICCPGTILPCRA
jgi:hypothetical protein